MMFRGYGSAGLPLCLAALLFRLNIAWAEIPIRDGGINPANLGKGDWIWYVSWATNRLGGAAPEVVNLPTLMHYYKAQGLQYIIVKAGTGSTNFNGGGPGPQFNSNLVHHAHAAGLLIFAYTGSYDDDVPGEIAMATRCFALGADGWVIDAESAWESGANQAGPNGPARAIQYGEGLRALFPNKFIAHAPFPIISFHPSFPYKEFGYYCDAVMPQAYWKSIYGNDPAAVEKMVTAMNNEYRAWQHSLTGTWTNAIKPIIPIGQSYNPSATQITTAAEVAEFFERLRNHPNPASVTGYKGTSFWRTDTTTAAMWTVISTNDLGDGPGIPRLTLQPHSQTVVKGKVVNLTAWGTGSKPFHYRWRFHGTNLPGATAPNLALTNAQFAQTGPYSVIVSNLTGVTTSEVAFVTVIEAPSLFDVTATAGATEAILSWSSTSPASSQVQFGLTPEEMVLTTEDPRLVRQHSVLLAGLTPGTTYFFAAISRNGTNSFRSSPSTFSTAGEIIVDNTAASYTGTWGITNGSADQFGSDYRYTGTVTGGGNASALYYPDIHVPGRYDVFVRHPHGANHSTNTPATIYHAGGFTSARVNQASTGGEWKRVGTNLDFHAGTTGFIRISNGTGETNSIVVADAIRLIYRVDQESPVGLEAPEWWTQYYLGRNADAGLDPDGDDLPSWAEYVAGTTPTDPTSRLDVWPDANSAQHDFRLYFRPHLAGRRYELESSTGLDAWTVLPDVPASPASNDGFAPGYFIITNTPGTIRLYRVKVSWLPQGEKR